MKDILAKIGLEIIFEYKYELSSARIMEMLMDKNQDERIFLGERIFGSRIPITTKDVEINDSTFIITKKVMINPFSGRGKIIGNIVSTGPNSTLISGKVVSNLVDFSFLIYGTIILGILWTPFIYFGTMGLEWILIGLAVLTFGTVWSTIYQRFEAKKVKRDFEEFLKRINVNK